MTAPEVRFQEPTFHDDDIAAKGDDTRDQDDTKGWRPNEKEPLLMAPRWKIRREPDPWSWSWGRRPAYRWALFLDGRKVDAYYVWENALTHVDNWCQDQKLRGGS